MEDPVQFVNVTFKGMEVGFNIAGKTVGGVAKFFKYLFHGINLGIHFFAIDKENRLNERALKDMEFKIKEKQLEMSKPVFGKVSMMELNERFGSQYRMISVPEDAKGKFMQLAESYGCAYSELGDYNISDGMIQIFVPHEQMGLYNQILEIINADKVADLSAEKESILNKMNTSQKQANEKMAIIGNLESQKENATDEEKAVLDNTIAKYKAEVDGINRDINSLRDALKYNENQLAREISIEDYAATAGGKSVEAISREGIIPQFEVRKLDEFLMTGFDRECRTEGIDYLANVGCSDISIERRLSQGVNGPMYTYTVFDGEKKLENMQLSVDKTTKNDEIYGFENRINSAVDGKRKQIIDSPDTSKNFKFNKNDCELYENVSNMDLLRQKQKAFTDEVKTMPAPSKSESLMDNSSRSYVESAIKNEEKLNKLDSLDNGHQVYIPVRNFRRIHSENDVIGNVPAGILIESPDGIDNLYFTEEEVKKMDLKFTDDQKYVLLNVPNDSKKVKESLFLNENSQYEKRGYQTMEAYFKTFEEKYNKECTVNYNGTALLKDTGKDISDGIKNIDVKIPDIKSNDAKR